MTILFLLALQDPAPFGFEGMEVYKVSYNTIGPVVADFNGDGLTDFAVANNAGSPRIEIFIQKTASEHAADLKKPPAYDHVNELHDDARFKKHLIPHEKSVFALAAGDLTADGRVDIAFHGSPAGVEIYSLDGDDWKQRQLIRGITGLKTAGSLAIADVDADGHKDLLMLGADSGNNPFVYVMRQQDDGALGTPIAYPTSLDDAHGLTFAASGSGRGAIVLHRTGSTDGIVVRFLDRGVVGPELRLKTESLRTVLPRWTADGLEILTVSSVSGRVYNQRVTATTGSGFGSPAQLFPLAKGAGRELAVGDLNGDGRPDLAISDPENASIDVQIQTDAYTFAAPLSSTTFAGTTNLQIGDFDGDGAAELLLVSPEEQVIGIARWADGKLGFPKALDGIKGKPICAIVDSLGGGTAMDLAYVYHEKGEWFAAIDYEFLTPKRKSVDFKIEFASENPSRLIALDLDNDGDRDIAVILPRDPFGLLLNAGDRFEPKDSKSFRGTNYLSGTKDENYGVARLGDRDVILVAKKNFGRALALQNGVLEVVEQYAGGRGARIAALGAAADGIVLVDEAANELKVVARDGAEIQSIPMPAKIGLDRVLTVPLADPKRPDFILMGERGFVVLRADGASTELETTWTYETDVKDNVLSLPAFGDFNGDKKPDLAMIDLRQNAELEHPSMEILTLGDEPARRLRFAVYEQKRLVSGGVGQLNALEAADVTGDKKTDLILQAHDRIIVYVQE